MKRSTLVVLASVIPVFLLVLMTAIYGMYTYISREKYLQSFYADIKHDRVDSVAAKIANDPSLLETKTSLRTGPLQVAVWQGSNKTVEYLNSIGCSPNEKWELNGPYYAYTLLHIAAIQGHKETCEILIRHGCNKDVASQDGSKPIDIATQNGHKHLQEILK